MGTQSYNVTMTLSPPSLSAWWQQTFYGHIPIAGSIKVVGHYWNWDLPRPREYQQTTRNIHFRPHTTNIFQAIEHKQCRKFHSRPIIISCSVIVLGATLADAVCANFTHFHSSKVCRQPAIATSVRDCAGILLFWQIFCNITLSGSH